jgi:hypothetical protein
MRVRVIGVVLALAVGFAMTGCASTAPASAPTPSPTEQATPRPTDPPISEAPASEPTCQVLARVDWQEQGGEWRQVAVGVPSDSGAREGAAGTAHLDSDGRVVGYTVAAGDAPSAIQDRFCIDGISVLHFNGYWVAGDGKDIAPEDYLHLAPNPTVRYVGPDV